MAKNDTAPPTSTRRGRPPKAAVADAAPTPTARKRGRPAKGAGLDLSQVTGSRVSKRTPARSQTKPAAAAARIAPRMRSKLRTRQPPATKVSKEEPAPKSVRRGRPPKNAAQVSAPKKAAGRKAAEVPVAKPTKPAKPAAPRKMRGHTVRQIPDRYIAQIDQLLHDLMEADAAAAPVEAEEKEAHEVEVYAHEDELNIEPTSATTADGGEDNDTEDAATELQNQQDDEAHQYSEGVTEDPAQSEAAMDEDTESNQGIEFDIDEQVDPMEHENAGGIMTPKDTDAPGTAYEHGPEDQGGLSPMQHQENVMHGTSRPSSAIMA